MRLRDICKRDMAAAEGLLQRRSLFSSGRWSQGWRNKTVSSRQSQVTDRRNKRKRKQTRRMDNAALAVGKGCSETFLLFFFLPLSAAIKAELQSNESRRWGLSSLCCVLCPLLMASRCGGISQVWLWKTFPHINPIRSDPAHEPAE